MQKEKSCGELPTTKNESIERRSLEGRFAIADISVLLKSVVTVAHTAMAPVKKTPGEHQQAFSVGQMGVYSRYESFETQNHNGFPQVSTHTFHLAVKDLWTDFNGCKMGNIICILTVFLNVTSRKEEGTKLGTHAHMHVQPMLIFPNTRKM